MNQEVQMSHTHTCMLMCTALQISLNNSESKLFTRKVLISYLYLQGLAESRSLQVVLPLDA